MLGDGNRQGSSRATRVLICVERPLAERIAELLKQSRELIFDPVISDRIDTARLRDAGIIIDALIVDIDLLPVERDCPLIAVHDDTSLTLDMIRLRGADDALGPDDLDARVIERTLRFVLERASWSLHLHDVPIDLDELTGLPNRRTLTARLNQAINRSKLDDDYHFSVLFLNIDGFRVLNDSIGISAADALLVQLAHRLRRCVNDSALVCRYGGDEFAILLDDIDHFDEADQLAEAIHRSLRRPFGLPEQQITTTVSIGIANSAGGYASAEEVLGDANAACNRAKVRGRSRSSTYHAGMRQEAYNTLRMQAELRSAVERNEFEVYYQPIVALRNWRLTGFEALVRWNHPKRGVVGPVEFIRLAENTRLIVPIGDFVLAQSCIQMAQWCRELPEAEALTISVNLSGHQLGSGNLVENIARVLEASGLEPQRLKLELTESTLIDEAEVAQRTLADLRALGVQIYIDDFGTGYSSLSYLHRFPINGLKIDKSFVDMVGRDDRKAAIVPSIVGLAHNLDMGVVAEGVETQEQARVLDVLDCAEAQGYLFSRPVPREQAEALVVRQILKD